MKSDLRGKETKQTHFSKVTTKSNMEKLARSKTHETSPKPRRVSIKRKAQAKKENLLSHVHLRNVLGALVPDKNSTRNKTGK